MPDVRSLHSRVAGFARRRDPHDPELEDARRDLKAARLTADLCRVVDEIPHDQALLDRVAVMLAEAPPITTSQRETAVRLLALRPAGLRPTGRTPDDREAA